VQQVLERVRAQREALALVQGERRWSYGELWAQVSTIARRLRALGVGRGQRVGLALPAGPELVMAELGVQCVGAAYVPLDIELPSERFGFMVKESRPSVLIGESEHGPDVVADVPWLQLGPADGGADEEPAETEARDGAYLIFTSGSTGKPKAASVHQLGLRRLLGWYRELCAGMERGIVVGSPSFDMTHKGLVGPLTWGGVVCFAESRRFDPWEILRTIEEQKCDLINCTPTAFQTLLEEARGSEYRSLSSLKRVVLGGEPLQLEPLRRWQRVSGQRARVVNSYGPTECSDIVAYHELATDLEQEPSPVAMGVEVPGTRLEVVDLDGQPLPAGAVGELVIDGDSVGLGYFERPELTERAFEAGGCGVNARRYRSGDRAMRLHNGLLRYEGRADQQVKLNGYRIELGEIEAALLGATGVSHAAASVQRDGRGHAILVAFYTTQTGRELDAEQLREKLGQTLAHYQIPSRYVHLPELPLTRSGKIDRKALPKQLPDTPALARGGAPAEALSPAERVLAEHWQALLGAAPATPEANFFELGGHSLLALELVRRVREGGGSASVDAVFSSPRLRDMALAFDGTSGDEPSIEALDETTAVELTPLQRRLWFMHRLEGPNASYNMAAAYELGSGVDEGVLLQAIGDTVARHWILRSRLQLGDELPLLAVQGRERVSVDVVDAPEAPEAAAAAEAGADPVTAFLTLPFDLEHDTLSRFRILHRGGRRYLLASIHHLACDGVSLGVLFRDLSRAYRTRSSGEPPPSARATVQFAELARALERRRDGARHRRELAELAEALRGAPVDSSLPPDWPRAARGGKAAERLELAWPPALRPLVQRLAARHSTSMFCVLLATWFWILARYRRQTDLIVGVPIACRDMPGSEEVVGALLNTLAVRLDVSGVQTLAELIEVTKQSFEHARARRDVPFEELVEAVNPARSLELSPLFQVQFVLDPVALAELDLGGVPMRALPVAGGDSKYDLNVHVLDGAEGLSGYIDYRAGLYERRTIESVRDSWFALLSQLENEGAALADPGRALRDLPIVDAARFRALQRVVSRHEPRYSSERAVHALIEERVRSNPDAIAVLTEDESLTYAELWRASRRLAQRLEVAGVQPGAVVAVCQGRGAERIISLLGILMAGAAYLPVDPEWPSERQRLVFETAGCRFAVVAPSLRDALTGGVERASALVLLEPGSVADRAYRGPAPEVAVTGRDVCYLMFTSGSTGVPKGVAIRHGGVAHDLHFLIDKVALGPGGRVLQLTPFSFDPSVRDLFATLGSGATAVVVSDARAKHPAAVLDLMLQARVTHVLSMVPTWLRALLAEHPDTQLRGVALHTLMLNGERLRGDDCARARRLFGPALRIVNQYGPTEATMTSATHELVDADLRALTVPLGTPNPNTALYVVDDAGQPLPQGAIGEVWITSAGVADGYINAPEQTAAQFISVSWPGLGGPLPFYRTGDLGRWRGDGVLEFLGRIDFQIKFRGHRVELGEIDAHLGQLPGVGHCATTLHEASDGRTLLIAFLTERQPGSLDLDGLRERLAQRLPAAMLPSQFVILPALPLTASGKVDRRRLPPIEPYLRDAPLAGRPAKNETEAAIAAVWAELLGLRAPPNVEASFFELGASSLSMLQARDRLARQFGEALSVIDLFQYPSIAALAAFIASGRAAAESTGRADAPAHASRRREFLQQRAARRRGRGD
jgi:amino acid adenylation domain-containing protein